MTLEQNTIFLDENLPILKKNINMPRTNGIFSEAGSRPLFARMDKFSICQSLLYFFGRYYNKLSLPETGF
jgi:hypothetical protein